MFQRQQSGSTLCPSCRQLVGVNDDECLNCGRKKPGMWGFSSAVQAVCRDLDLVSLVTWACGGLYVMTLLVDMRQIGMGGIFSMLSPSPRSLFVFGASGSLMVFEYGRWWTVLSAGWLHGGLLHIFFNMMWVKSLAYPTIQLFGAGRTMILYTVSSVVGFLASSVVGYMLPGLPRFLAGAGFTVGASAPIFGLLGALYLYGQRTGSSHVSQHAKSYALLLGLFGFILPGVDNWAHAGGFVGGYLAARLLDPLKPESPDHMVWGLACLAASFVAIVASVIHGLSFLR